MAGVLGPLGFDDAEEAVYEFLVGRSHATPAQITSGTALTARQVRVALTELHRKRFVEYGGGRSGWYEAGQPDEVFEPLLRERQRELDSARAAVARMLAEHRTVARARAVHDMLKIADS